MVRGAACAMLVAVWCAWCARASVLVSTYVLPPESFAHDRRGVGPPPDSVAADSQRMVRRLVGGHIKIRSDKEYGDPAKNSFIYDEKNDRNKFASVLVPDRFGGSVGWNQGIWDDGMLMSSAGEGKKETGKSSKDDDEDKKTLSDQVAEGKYGLIQNEIFSKPLKRPGIVSYDNNSETRSKDNINSLGGLKKDEIWLAEDHLLVLKGGSFPERSKETDRRPWPAIDDYEAPRRQVKLPQKPKVPPPFPVRLSDDGPLVFLTPNGSVPAALFPSFFAGESDGSLPFAPFPFPPGPNYAQSDYQGNLTSGGTPFPNPPFPFLPGNASEGPIFPFPPSINGSFPEGFPPGAAFLPPPSNQSDLYDEDDPSIYYPPPYNFSYHAENNSVPAGPLVPGIVLPPPPDFFAPLDEESTSAKESTTTDIPTVKPTIKSRPITKRPLPTSAYRKPYKTRPTTEQSTKTTEEPSTVTITSNEPTSTPKQREPTRIVQIPQRNKAREHNLPDLIQTRPKTEKPVYKIRQKVTSKPLSVSVIYDYPDQGYNEKVPTTSPKPYVVYNVGEATPNLVTDNIVTSTPIPLRAYFSNNPNNEVPTTKLQPVYNQRPNESAVASFYFYDEQPKTTAAPVTYFDGQNYYKAIPVSQVQATRQNLKTQGGFTPSIDVTYGSVDQGDPFFSWPQKQGTRTLTQEYFSIQKPKVQEIFVQPPARPNAFYQQIADIQQTIDFFTTKKPKHPHRQHGVHKPKSITSRPVYQFSYQSKPRPEPVNFRAPKLDPEPFRPMVSYSEPFNVQNDYNTVTPSTAPVYHQQYLIENVKVTTETPTLQKYYAKPRPTVQSNFDKPNKEHRPATYKKNKNHIVYDRPEAAVLVHAQNHLSTTPNPISHGYYTKQDERYFDDITKNSFDIFGKKIEDGTHDVNGLAATPPLETVKTPIDNNINLQYAYEILESQSPNPPTLEGDTIVNERLPRPTINPDSETISPNVQTNGNLVLGPKPPSLEDDTIVNDLPPRPTINPDSEFVPISNPEYRAQYNEDNRGQQPQYTDEQYDLNQPSLVDDTAVNFRRPLPPINPDAEWIGPVNSAGEGRPGSFVSYRLPGEGAHVYFLTPQAARAARDRYNAFRSPGYGR
ncbi:hypothetical protein EVAR_10209_1 [Eumeta japonica]|uniref:Uncharacterized protein n=1 Tax=Eumeta variegata TaxID=151549 RepID=A0A4C1TGJ0_EUMVA|nr:hypothetical protein EVAR_10209_1 [Eumeta japonica]